jgi:peroxiredoxin Q/BCP
MIGKIFSLIAGIVIVIGIIIAYEGTTMLKVGDQAPGFTAATSTGEQFQLSTYRGKSNVVLFFYPQDFTAGCTAQACAFRDSYAEIKKYEAVIFGVSLDNAAAHEKFAASYHLPFPLISDAGGAISKLYQARWLFGLWPYAKRVTYVIDKKGIVRSVIHHEVNIGRHLEDLLHALQECASGS